MIMNFTLMSFYYLTLIAPLIVVAETVVVEKMYPMLKDFFSSIYIFCPFFIGVKIQYLTWNVY